MIRVLGLSLIAVSPAVFGMVLAHSEQKKPAALAALIRLIEHIRLEIEHFYTPRAELLDRFSDPVLEENGALCAMRACLQDASGNSFSAFLSENANGFGLDADARAVLDAFVRALGTTELSEELNRARAVIEELEKRAKQVREETQNRVRLDRSFGIVCGVCALLFFI